MKAVSSGLVSVLQTDAVFKQAGLKEILGIQGRRESC